MYIVKKYLCKLFSHVQQDTKILLQWKKANYGVQLLVAQWGSKSNCCYILLEWGHHYFSSSSHSTNALYDMVQPFHFTLYNAHSCESFAMFTSSVGVNHNEFFKLYYLYYNSII